MPSYLILRVISFLIAVCVPLFLFHKLAFSAFVIPLTLAHYFLALPYSKKYVANVMKRRSTSLYFMALIAFAFTLSSIDNEKLLVVFFGVHYVFSEVYLMYNNVLPNRWKDTRALRVSSIVCNTFVYLAALRSSFFNHNPQAEIFNWIGYVVSACVFVYHLLKIKKSLTREQLVHCCAFEILGLAFVIAGIMHPIPVLSFVFYHVLFWVLYPSWKMIEFKQTRSLVVFLGSNIVLTGLFALIGPYSPLALHLNWQQWYRLFSVGALVHIVISLAMTTAQPAWITRIFHPEFARRDDSDGNAVLPAAPVARQAVLQR
jgi:hypothetical protein